MGKEIYMYIFTQYEKGAVRKDIPNCVHQIEFKDAAKALIGIHRFLMTEHRELKNGNCYQIDT